MTETLPFEGFTGDAIAFLQDLRANNERVWFNEHKKTYETAIKQPAQAFCHAMTTGLEALTGKPHGHKIFRIHRDVRFSKDKTPYQPRLHFVFWRGAKPAGSSGFHFVIHADSLGAGVGNWAFGPEQLERYRAAVADAKSGAALTKAIETGMAGPGMILDAPALKRVPSGFDADSPQADLLKHKGVVVRGDRPIPDALFGPGAVDLALDVFRPFVPLHDWLVAHTD